jgi:hypothetical protein
VGGSGQTRGLNEAFVDTQKLVCHRLQPGSRKGQLPTEFLARRRSRPTPHHLEVGPNQLSTAGPVPVEIPSSASIGSRGLAPNVAKPVRNTWQRLHPECPNVLRRAITWFASQGVTVQRAMRGSRSRCRSQQSTTTLRSRPQDPPPTSIRAG